MQNKIHTLFPEIDSYHDDFLITDDGHKIFYEISGNPNGYPVVFLHGGPGGGCGPNQRRFFDPKFYKIILLDQRGCSRSIPQGSTNNNTTAHLVGDLDAIRKKLSIERWLVFGGSWGSTLALSYATKYANHVSGLILRGIFLSRASELNWFLNDIQNFYPDIWQKLENFLPENKRGNVLDSFTELVFNDDPSVCRPASAAWNNYESSIMSLIPKQGLNNDQEASASEQDLEVHRARVQIHYINNACFIDGAQLLKACEALNHIPTVIVQGRYDMVCPPKSAWELSQVMPHAEFHIIQDAGHSAMETGVVSALVGATEQFKCQNN